MPRHDMDVEVGDALAHPVVDGHEGSVRPEAAGILDGAGDALHRVEQDGQQVGGQIGECVDMRPWNDQHVAVEHRGPVEEGNDRVLFQHGVSGRFA